MVVSTLIYHPSVAQYLRFVATTVGRDKLLRTLQFISRFLSWYFYRKGYSVSVLTPLASLQKSFGSARKVMRLGKNIEHLKASATALDSKTLDSVASYLTAGRQLGYFGYLTLDNIAWLDSTGIYKLQSAKRLNREAQRLWLMGLLFSIANGVYALKGLQEREERVSKADAEGAIEVSRIQTQRVAAKTQLVSDCADMVLPVAGLGILGIDEGIVGLSGVVSSLIGLRAAWRKSA